jgi:hypothetical protein
MTDKYKTTDIVLAASLKVSGFDLTQIELQGTKGIFVFEGVEQKFLMDFDLGKISVEPVVFNNTIKQLTTSVRRMV